MANCLFINHSMTQCGVYQYGKRLCDIMSQSKVNDYEYFEITSLEEYQILLKHYDHDCVIHNYHASTMPWLNDNNIVKDKKSICIFHESDLRVLFDTYINTDSTFEDSGIWYGIPRPLFDYKVADNTKNEIVTIGTFGFAFPQKGFERIVEHVNSEFDEAILRIHIPNAYFGDFGKAIQGNITDKCNSIKVKEGIKIKVTHDFLPDNELLYFLNSNTINIFLYDDMLGRGLSSVIDYALSVNRPIAISNSNVFRHIYSDEICVSKTNIKTIIDNGTKPLNQFKEKWSNENLIKKFDYIVNSNL